MVYLTTILHLRLLRSELEEGAAAYFEVVSQHLLGRIQESYEKASHRITGRRGCEILSYVHVASRTV
jgi:hypothetical protein